MTSSANVAGTEVIREAFQERCPRANCRSSAERCRPSCGRQAFRPVAHQPPIAIERATGAAGARLPDVAAFTADSGPDLVFGLGAGEGNRTLMTSLEDRRSSFTPHQGARCPLDLRTPARE